MIETDGYAGASALAMRDHLTAPLRAGAMDLPCEIDAGGVAGVPLTLRQPLLVLALAAALEDDALIVGATITHGAVVDDPITLTFAPYTEAAAPLPLYRPDVDATTGLAAPFSVALTATHRAAGGTITAVAPADLATWLTATVIEGVTGRMLVLLGAEKARLRRAGRELTAQVRLSRARDHALDRHGSDLGVARFAEALAVSDGQIVTEIQREDDVAYRRRLGLYRPFLLPNRTQILGLLNGPGSGVNAGPLGALGVTDRFTLVDTPNTVAIAVHLLGGGATGATRRAAVLDAVRAAYLIWPQANAASNNAHAARPVAEPIAEQQAGLRAGVRAGFTFADSKAAIAPMLAAALSRVAALRKALGQTKKLDVTRAQDASAGSRYELGLGVDLKAPLAADLDLLFKNASKLDLTKVADPETRAILAAVTPVARSDDPDGAWLFNAAGLRTVHRVTGSQLYVSHLPVGGLRIDAPDQATSGAASPIAAYDEAPGTGASNALLTGAVTAALAAWGGPAPTVLAAPATGDWNGAEILLAGSRVLDVWGAAGLPELAVPTAAVHRLETMPPELVATLRLSPAQSQRIISTGSPAAAATELRGLVDALQAQGIVSVLAFKAGPEILVMASIVPLPEAGLNIAGRRAETFRWYQVAISGFEGTLSSSGARNTFTPLSDSLVALVCVAYERSGLVDPYEYRVELPDGALLGLEAYEFLMNLLDHAHPMGVQVNTYEIRHDHVDVGNTGSATPLAPRVSRTYRRFQRRRLRGAEGVGLDD